MVVDNRGLFKLIYLNGARSVESNHRFSSSGLNERMTEKKTKESGSEVLVMDAKAFSEKFPTSHRTGGRGRSERIQLAIEAVGKMLEEKKKGYIVINGDPFFASGTSAAIRKQYPKADNITLHWFDLNKPEVKEEVSKVTKQTSRYLVQIELI